MGYRSNIVIYIEETEGTTLEQIIKGAFIADNENEPDECEIGENSNGKRVLLIEYNDTKWYDDYPIVKYWKNIFEELDDKHYLYTRDGEYWDDFEIEGSYGEVYPTLDVEYDVDFSSIKNKEV